MKNKLFLIAVSFLFSKILLAQTEANVSNKLKELNNDTIRYTKEQIIESKDLFIGKQLDLLLRNLPLPVKEYTNAFSDRQEGVYNYTYILMYSYKEREEKVSQKKNPLAIVIKWATPLTKRELDFLGLKYLGGEWTNEVYNFFKDRIIKDISIVKYDF
jgi:hypothetical protein